MGKTVLFRCCALLIATGLSVAGSYLFLRLTGEGGLTALDLVRCVLVAVSSFWLVWGGTAAVFGVFTPHRQVPSSGKPLVGRTAILVPIYNEDAMATFARVAAMNRSLIAQDAAEHFHFAVLSDTQSMECIAQEAVWFERLMQEPNSLGRIFYRRRERNIGRKAGNIEDFIQRSGGAYDYALILDADSLMEGTTIVEMVRRMDADAKLALLQTVPHIVNARTLFGRAMQFSASYLSPTFARGASLMQGHEGPYWGHNAIVRVQAFAASCGLPQLSGKPPFGGHILSHDYVEAALLSRAGWKVQVDPALGGSFEEGPENLIEYAKRDRRWCQGNLQHGRLLAAPGLKFWSRFTFLQGMFAYLASPLWLALLVISILAGIFPDQAMVLSGFDAPAVAAWTLGAAVVVILVMPKMLIMIRGVFDRRNRDFGGTKVALLSVLGEIVLSTVLAPVMLMLQGRAVVQVLLGLDGGWPPTKRGQNWVGVLEALRFSWWIVLFATLAMGGVLLYAPSAALWVAPAMLPAMAAPLLISLTSRPSRQALPLLFRNQIETAPPTVLEQQRSIVAAWANPSHVMGSDPIALLKAVSHVTA